MKPTIQILVLLSIFIMPTRAQDQTQPSRISNVVQDSVVIKKVLKVVRSHILSATKDRRKPLVIREKRKSRRFIVINFFGSVSKNKNVYTALVDVDEYDHKIPRILYVDVRVTKGVYKVSKIRIGPNHFRENDKARGLEE